MKTMSKTSCSRSRTYRFCKLGILICYLVVMKLAIQLSNKEGYIRKHKFKAKRIQHSFHQRQHDSDLFNRDLTKKKKAEWNKKRAPDFSFNLTNNNPYLQNDQYKPQDEYKEDDKVIVTNDQNESNRKNTDQQDSNVQSLNKRSIVVDGIYWSNEVENLIPEGFSNDDIKKNIKSLTESHVEVLQPATLEKCGRPRNAYVIMSDGTQACARYRHEDSRYLFGDVLSFYLSRLIQLDNVPAVVLTRVTNSSTQWRDTPYKTLEWEEGRIIALVQWINDSRGRVKIPKLILMALEKNVTIDAKMIAKAVKSVKGHRKFLLETAQFGTMIIFDYLTANYDRVARMQMESEQKGRIRMQKNIKNLYKSNAGKLWLIDNEYGLLEAYHLNYDPSSSLGRHHRRMLQTMCIFQKPIVTAVRALHNNTSPHLVLEQYARNHEALLDEVPKNKYYHRLFKRHFHERLQEVMDWINFCEKKK